MDGKKPKVVFTYVEAGMGHIMPMSGMQDAFEKKYGDKCEIVKSYVFAQSKYKEVRKMGAMQSQHAKRMSNSRLLSILEAISYAFPSRLVLFFLDRVFGKGRKLFFNDAKELNPDLLVSSYYLPAHLFRQANEKGLTDTLIVTYTPDYCVYPAWDRKCDVFLTHNEMAATMAIKHGFKKETVKIVPFIFKSGIENARIDKAAARKGLGLKDEYTILCTNGAYGTKNMIKLGRLIARENLPVKFIAVCGKNQALYKTLTDFAATFSGRTEICPIGFTDKLPEYMAAADLIIGKSSPGTVREALLSGAPMITDGYINHNEKYCFAYCGRHKITVCEKRTDRIIDIIKKDLENSGYIKSLLSDLAPYRDFTGAEKAADVLFGLLKTRFPDL